MILFANDMDKDCKYWKKVLINMYFSFAYKKLGTQTLF